LVVNRWHEDMASPPEPRQTLHRTTRRPVIQAGPDQAIQADLKVRLYVWSPDSTIRT
jgi:hypothetical protein